MNDGSSSGYTNNHVTHNGSKDNFCIKIEGSDIEKSAKFVKSLCADFAGNIWKDR